MEPNEWLGAGAGAGAFASGGGGALSSGLVAQRVQVLLSRRPLHCRLSFWKQTALLLWGLTVVVLFLVFNEVRFIHITKLNLFIWK